MKRTVMAILLASLAASANASVFPGKAECKATIKIENVLPKTQQVELEVTDTDCKFLTKGKKYTSDSFIGAEKLQKGQVIKGEAAQGGSLGPEDSAGSERRSMEVHREAVRW